MALKNGIVSALKHAEMAILKKVDFPCILLPYVTS